MVKIYQLSTAFEIAKKISFQKQKTYTRFIVHLSVFATAISVAAILLTLSIVNGFQETISGKVYSFWGNIRVSSINGDLLKPDSNTLSQLKQIPNVKSVEPFNTQSTVLAYGQEIEGVNARGMSSNTSIPFLIQGAGLHYPTDSSTQPIVLSDLVAKKLNIPLHAIVRLYFLNNGNVQQKKMTVVGLYHSGMEEYDQQYVMVPMRTIQQLQQSNNQFEGYTITVNNIALQNETNTLLQKTLPPNQVATTIDNYYPQIFDWIGVQTINRNVTISILLIIAIVNLLTCLFILMLERVPMIGTLTTLGAPEQMIRQIFLYQASFICWMGIGLGSMVGIGLAWSQQYFGWIQLDESAYFVKTLPVKLEWAQIGCVLFGTAMVSYISFLIPTLWIKKISPAKAVQFK